MAPAQRDVGPLRHPHPRIDKTDRVPKGPGIVQSAHIFPPRDHPGETGLAYCSEKMLTASPCKQPPSCRLSPAAYWTNHASIHHFHHHPATLRTSPSQHRANGGNACRSSFQHDTARCRHYRTPAWRRHTALNQPGHFRDAPGNHHRRRNHSFRQPIHRGFARPARPIAPHARYPLIDPGTGSMGHARGRPRPARTAPPEAPLIHYQNAPRKYPWRSSTASAHRHCKLIWTRQIISKSYHF